MVQQLGGGIFNRPAPQPVPWRYSMQANGVSLATYLGDVQIDGSLIYPGQPIVPAISPSYTAAQNTAAIQAALDAIVGRGAILIPGGVYDIAGNLTCANKSVAVYGLGSDVSVLRQTTSGGFVFTGDAQVQYDMDNFSVSGLRMEAGAANCGVAITITLAGGSGEAPVGPTFDDLQIVAQGAGKYWTKGVRGTNLRNAHFNKVTIGGTTISGATTHGVHLDGASDPVEIWFTDVYLHVMEIGILVEGTYEGIYLNGVRTVSLVTCVAYEPTTAQPVLIATNCYFNSVEAAVKLDLISYFQITACSFSSSGLVAEDWQGIYVNRSTGGQINASLITSNIFVGGNVTPPETETGIFIASANHITIDDNVFYSCDIGISADANSADILIGGGNQYPLTPAQWTMPGATRAKPLGTVRANCNGAAQSFPVNVTTVINYPVAPLDDAGWFDTVQSRFTPRVGIYNWYFANLFQTGVLAGDIVSVALQVNGATTNQIHFVAAAAGFLPINGVFQIYQTNETDYWTLTVNVQPSSGTADRVTNSNAVNAYCRIEPLSS